MVIQEIKCKKCGHIWHPRVERPVECPNCKSRKWRVNNGTA